MNISWVLADSCVIDPTVDIGTLKEIGPIWGSWRTWRSCQTDNVICHKLNKAQDLLNRNFQNSCNFYVPNSLWINLDRPENVNLYEGAFVDEFQPEEIIAMHLAASNSDIVLLLGFDWSERLKNPNRLEEHKFQAYRSLVSHAISDNSSTQWVLVDHTAPIMKMFSKLKNLTKDSMENCLELKDI
jgi:hypothetical protein